jgi:hypothetical protein
LSSFQSICAVKGICIFFWDEKRRERRERKRLRFPFGCLKILRGAAIEAIERGREIGGDHVGGCVWLCVKEWKRREEKSVFLSEQTKTLFLLSLCPSLLRRSLPLETSALLAHNSCYILQRVRPVKAVGQKRARLKTESQLAHTL